MSEKLLVGIQEKPESNLKWFILSLQHVFAMFGATVLVPILVNLNAGTQVLDTSVTLVASGVGTLIYIAFTKAKAPVYLGSSFAYIAAMSTAGAISKSSVYFGLMLVGLIYVAVAMIIRFAGSGWLKKLLPPVVIGPVIITIGLGLAPVAVQQSGIGGIVGPAYEGGAPLWDLNGVYWYLADTSIITWAVPTVAIITFATVVGVALFTKGFTKIIPFIIAILVGWVFSAIFGIVNWDVFKEASFFQMPNFSFVGTYAFDAGALILFAPIAFVTIAEHIGDHTVLGEICGEDFLTDPGLDKTLLGDGVATFVSAAMGGPANTTYGENTGVVAMTKVGSVYVTGLAAIFAILLGFLGYIAAFINSIPWAVIGGMTIVLYGLIAGNGVKVLVKAKVDLSKMRNLIIVSTILVIGLGGAFININSSAQFAGMSLAAVVGIILNLILPEKLVTEE